MGEPALAEAPPRLRRVARAEDPLLPSTIDRAVAREPLKGNRFDVVGAGVLYSASDAVGAYAETTAHLRPSAAVRAVVHDEDPDFLVAGTITAGWRERRRLVTVTLDKPLPFVDVEDPATHEFLTTELASALSGLGVGILDVPTVTGPDRRVTRTIAAWVYDATGPGGEPLYSGIRYPSRLGQYECWAVFDGNSTLETELVPITRDDPQLTAIAESWNLRIQ